MRRLAALLTLTLLPGVGWGQVSYNPTIDERVASLEKEVVKMRGQITSLQKKLGEYPNTLGAHVSTAGERRVTTSGDTIERQTDGTWRVVAATPRRLASAPVLMSGTAGDGHTHTCSRGHTWNHSMDGGSHNCPQCGEHVTLVDPPGRMAGSGRSFAMPPPMGYSPPPLAYRPPFTLSGGSGMMFGGGGCGPAGCAAPQGGYGYFR